MKSRSSCGHLAQAMVMVWLLHASTLLLSSSNGQEYDSSYEEHLNFSDVFTDIAEDLTTGYSHGGPETIHTAFRSHCQACQFRNVYAMASLKSIQAHVLMKLGIDSMPNRTQYPKIPRHILESFTRQEGVPLHSPSMVRDTDYMADEPSAGVEEIEEDFDYYPITNKIYILAKRHFDEAQAQCQQKSNESTG
uniref:Uncharacterized protein n=1 Tax=Anopheles melas TaxID=34690 RepID=A0A182UCM6_9DIPT